MSKILFVGGPGNISESTVREVLKRNNEVGIFTLPESPDKGLKKNVRFYHGDRNSTEEIKTAIDDFKPDMTVDFCCFTPDQAESLASLIKKRVGRHLFVSTCDIYGYPLSRIPFGESDPYNKTISQYATDKLKCEEIFWDEHERGNIQLTVARPSYSFGPPFVLSFFSRFGGLELISRLKAKKPVVVPGDGQTLMHPSAAYNTGKMIAEIILEPKTGGEGFTCGHETYMTTDKYYQLFAQALGVEAKLVHIPKDLLYPLENNIIPDDLLSELTGFHVALSMKKFKNFFPNFRWEKSIARAAKEFVDYHEKNGNIPPFRNNFEDLLIDAWNKCRKAFKP
jgi:nucleoside-diphosphate-sugar epimerase